MPQISNLSIYKFQSTDKNNAFNIIHNSGNSITTNYKNIKTLYWNL